MIPLYKSKLTRWTLFIKIWTLADTYPLKRATGFCHHMRNLFNYIFSIFHNRNKTALTKSGTRAECIKNSYDTCPDVR